MIETLKKFKYLIIVVVIIIAAFIAYTIYTSGIPAASSDLLQKTTMDVTNTVPGTPGSDPSIPNEALANSFVEQLLTIDSINLKIAFLNDPIFNALKDTHIDIQSQPIGRVNPFAPVGKDSGPDSGRYQFSDGTVGSAPTDNVAPTGTTIAPGVFYSNTTSPSNVSTPSVNTSTSSSKTKNATTSKLK